MCCENDGVYTVVCSVVGERLTNSIQDLDTCLSWVCILTLPPPLYVFNIFYVCMYWKWGRFVTSKTLEAFSHWKLFYFLRRWLGVRRAATCEQCEPVGRALHCSRRCVNPSSAIALCPLFLWMIRVSTWKESICGGEQHCGPFASVLEAAGFANQWHPPCFLLSLVVFKVTSLICVGGI